MLGLRCYVQGVSLTNVSPAAGGLNAVRITIIIGATLNAGRITITFFGRKKRQSRSSALVVISLSPA